MLRDDETDCCLFVEQEIYHILKKKVTRSTIKKWIERSDIRRAPSVNPRPCKLTDEVKERIRYEMQVLNPESGVR
jgi:hypothetical protein